MSDGTYGWEREALDRLQIAETIARYGAHYDVGEFEGFAALFTEDSEYNIVPDPGIIPLPIKGRDEIVAAMRARFAQVTKMARRRHVTTNTIYHEISGDAARTSTFLVAFSAPREGPVEIRGTGVYHDEFRKQDGRWLIAKRLLILDSLKPDEPRQVPALVASDSLPCGPQSVEEEINTEIGEPLPGALSEYTRIDPDLFRAYRMFRSEILDKGVVARKDKLLMSIAILTATKQGDAMGMYASIARNEGATPQEIREAIRVGVLFSGGPGIAAAAKTAAVFASDAK